MLEFQNPTKRDDVLDVDPGLESSMQTTSLENAGAGSGILWLHFSEVARAPWQSEGGQEAMTTALQTVPNEPGTAVIKESTAQGAGNSFHMDWLQAENGESDYLAFFAPWWEEPTYVAKVPADFERTSEETQIAEVAEHSRHCPCVLSDEQFQWRRVTIANECRGQLDMFKQEYPSTPREAFLTSGRPFFDPESGGAPLRAHRDEPADAISAMSSRRSATPSPSPCSSRPGMGTCGSGRSHRRTPTT